MAPRAVLFDLDDTLYPETDYVRSGFHAVALWAQRDLGLPAEQVESEFLRLFDEGVRGDTFNRWLRSRGLSPDAHAGPMIGVYREHMPQIVPYPAVRPLLDSLRNGYRLGLVTDGRADEQGRKLTALKLAGCFDAIVCTDDLGPGASKPSPRPFAVVLAALGVAPQSAVYVGDNPSKDFLGARRAGMTSIRLRLDGTLHAAAEPATPEHAPDGEVQCITRLEGEIARLTGVAPVLSS